MFISTLLTPDASLAQTSPLGQPSLGQFPTIIASNLADEQFTLPKDFQGDLNIVLIAFRMEQQYDVDTWLPKVKEIVRENPSLRYYELPTIGGLWTLMRGQIDNWMKAGIPDMNARKATITLYTNTQNFREPLLLPSEDRIYVLLVDKSGKVWWKSDGRYADEKLASLKAAIQSAETTKIK